MTGAVGWRKDNLRYKKNEVFLDIVEQVCPMSSRSQISLQEYYRDFFQKNAEVMACRKAPCHCSPTGIHIAAQGQQHRAVDQLVAAGVLIGDGRIGLCCVCTWCSWLHTPMGSSTGTLMSTKAWNCLSVDAAPYGDRLLYLVIPNMCVARHRISVVLEKK